MRSASVAATKIQAMGVNWALSAQVLEYHRGKLMQIVPDKRTKAEVQQLADIENLLDMLKTTTDQLKDVGHGLLADGGGDVPGPGEGLGGGGQGGGRRVEPGDGGGGPAPMKLNVATVNTA